MTESLPPSSLTGWEERLIFKWKNSGEVLEPSLANVVTILTCHAAWRGVIARDDFSLKIVTLREPDWATDDRPLKSWAPKTEWTDEDFSRVRNWFARGFYIEGRGKNEIAVKKSDVEEAIPMVASRNAFHPLRDFLRSLKWDGTDRIGGAGSDAPGWLHVYMGASDTTYTRTVGRWWLVSAVARPLRPGCKADCMLVFEGGQGRGKSTACRIIGGDYFTDQVRIDEIGTKDGKLALHSGKWIVENAELDGINRAETSRIKAEISAQEDFFRAPYAKAPKAHLRQFVLIGSVNEATWLRDETGNRRFWPVKVEEDGAIAIDKLTTDREQILAQAVELFDAGERWWPSASDPIAPHLEREQSSRMLTDDWTDKIAEWLGHEDTSLRLDIHGNPYVTTTELGEKVLRIEIGKWGRSDQMRAGGCLTRLGYERKQVFEVGGRRVWAYVKPERPPDRRVRERDRVDTPPSTAPPQTHHHELPF